jgi:hypothetical protein
MVQLLLPLRRLLLQVLLLLLMFFVSRCAFTLINHSHFQHLHAGVFIRLAFHALRYDLSAIAAVNTLYLLLLLFPVPYWNWPRWERFVQWAFIVTNSFAFLFELADWAYFPYNFKRATADVLGMVSRQGDFWSILPSYLLSYWYVPLAVVLFIWGFIRLNRRICKATPLRKAPEFGHLRLMPFWQFVELVLIGGLAAIAIRGGLQYIPIGIRNAVQVAESRYVPIVLNTPFSIISTLSTPALEVERFMPDAEAARIMPFRHRFSEPVFTKRNVVLIILESGSKEFSALGRKPSFMPFLDSLMQTGFSCTQAFANGQTSAEGIPAIIAGIPTLMDESFPTSNYGANRIDALPGLLKQEGYNSAFFHGGTNGTMSFDVFTAAAGFDKYFGRSEYANETDYDGAWGIRDKPYLQYVAQNLSGMKEPFMAAVFTLSAHPPYNIPAEERKRLPKGPLQVQQCIAYTDEAVRDFFRTASKAPWFRNTLFVITADHCSPQNGGGFYAQGLGQFAIPLVLYAPGDSKLRGVYDKPVQQLDIMPSILQYLGYNAPFFGYGNSMFDTTAPRFVITRSSDAYQWLENGALLQTAGNTPKAWYAYPTDSLSEHNGIDSNQTAQRNSITRIRAFIQRYQETLIHNTMH